MDDANRWANRFASARRWRAVMVLAIACALTTCWFHPVVALASPAAEVDGTLTRDPAASYWALLVHDAQQLSLIDWLPPLFPPISPLPDASAPTSLGLTKPSDAEAAIQVVIGLLLLALLLGLSSLPAVRRWEERLGVGQFATSVVPFIIVGALAARPSWGILTPSVLGELRPILHFAVAWFGFSIGFRFDVREVRALPAGSLRRMLSEAAIPAAFMFGAAIVLAPIAGASLVAFSTWRACAILALAAAMTGPPLMARVGRLDTSRHEADAVFSQLDEIVGVVGMILISALLRPTSTFDASAAMTWIAVQIGLGVCVGGLMLLMLRLPRRPTEFLALFIGVLALAAGLATYLSFSPLVVGFLSGATVINMYRKHADEVNATLVLMTRPVNALFLLVAGALWNVTAWQGIAVATLLVSARYAGRQVPVRWARRRALRADGAFWRKRARMTTMSVSAVVLAVSLEMADGRSAMHVAAGVLTALLVIEFWVAQTARGMAGSS